MDNKFQTSFIPQKPAVTIAKNKENGVNFLLLVAVVVFISSVIATGLVYLWQSQLKNQIDAQATQLKTLRNETDQKTIDSLIQINDLLDTAKILLRKHIAVSPLFQFLQVNTITNVRFKSFAFSYTDDNKINVKMAGQAKDFATISAQAESFNQSEVKTISNPIFSDFAPQADGTITFNFSADIQPSTVNYYDLKNVTDSSNEEEPVNNSVDSAPSSL